MSALRHAPPMKLPRLDRRRAGFTLVELMVALVIGALVVAAMFTVGGASARHFQEQQRVGVTQRSVRQAMERVRRDIARAGYGHVPDHEAPGVRTCPVPTFSALDGTVAAIQFVDGHSDDDALAEINREDNATTGDRIRLIGNYNTADSYLASSIDGDTVYLQTDWLAFRRSFVVGTTASPLVDDHRFEDVVFRAGTMLHIHVPQTNREFFVGVASASIDATSATITLTESIPLGTDCMPGYGGQAIVTPLALIEYAIEEVDASSPLAPANEDVTGVNTVLVRRQLRMDTGAVMTDTVRTILEYAVHFDLRFIVDTTPLAAAPTIGVVEGDTAEALIDATPWMLRGVEITLAARTPEQDPRFPWPDDWSGGRPATAPLNRYRVFDDRAGAARVRVLTTEVQLPNFLR